MRMSGVLLRAAAADRAAARRRTSHSGRAPYMRNATRVGSEADAGAAPTLRGRARGADQCPVCCRCCVPLLTRAARADDTPAVAARKRAI
eukprot:gene34933-55654_t